MCFLQKREPWKGTHRCLLKKSSYLLPGPPSIFAWPRAHSLFPLTLNIHTTQAKAIYLQCGGFVNKEFRNPRYPKPSLKGKDLVQVDMFYWHLTPHVGRVRRVPLKLWGQASASASLPTTRKQTDSEQGWSTKEQSIKWPMSVMWLRTFANLTGLPPHRSSCTFGCFVAVFSWKGGKK